jgi:hypothetical protein
MYGGASCYEGKRRVTTGVTVGSRLGNLRSSPQEDAAAAFFLLLIDCNSFDFVAIDPISIAMQHFSVSRDGIRSDPPITM